MTFQEESRLREVALNHACHDLKGNRPQSEVIDRAQMYLNFLLGLTGDPKAD